jgi:integrase
MKRRKHIEQGIYRYGDTFLIAYTDSSGKVVGPIKTTARTLEQARARRAEAMARVDAGIDIQPKKTKFKVVAQEYVDSLKARAASGDGSQRSVINAELRLKNHILPKLGHIPIQNIRVAQIKVLAEKLQRSEMAPLSARSILATTSAVFSHAVEAELIGRNPCKALTAKSRPKSKRKSEPRFLTAAEVARLLDGAPKSYRLLLATTVFCGLRTSEVLGLRWQDIDLENGVLHVRFGLTRATKTEPAKLAPLKTDGSIRDIDLAPNLVRELRLHKVASGHSKDLQFVFCTSTGKPMYYRNVISRGLDRAADQARLNRGGVPRLGMHDLRHTAISLLIDSGADVVQVAKFAGHAKPTTTLDIYAHAFERRQKAATGFVLGGILEAAGALQ